MFRKIYHLLRLKKYVILCKISGSNQMKSAKNTCLILLMIRPFLKIGTSLIHFSPLIFKCYPAGYAFSSLKHQLSWHPIILWRNSGLKIKFEHLSYVLLCIFQVTWIIVYSGLHFDWWSQPLDERQKIIVMTAICCATDLLNFHLF